MKNRLLCLFTALFMFSFVGLAQIENEIKSFVDSTELFFNNGRKLLLQQVQQNDYVKVYDVYFALTKKAESFNCTPFYFDEELYIACLTNNWVLFIDKTVNYKLNSKIICYDKLQPIENILYGKTQKNAPEILAAIDNTTLTNEEKDIIGLFLILVQKGSKDELYIEKLKHFNSTYKNTKFADFLKLYMPAVPVKGSFAYSFGVTGLRPTAKIGANFDANVMFSMSMDINVNKVFTSLYMNGGSLKINSTYSAQSGNQMYTFINGDSFSYFDGGLMAGYFIVRNNYFHVAPYFTIGGSSLESNLFKSTDEGDEISIFDSFIYGPGLHTELKLIEFTQNSYYSYYYPNNAYYYKMYFSIKLDAGYNIINNHADSFSSGNLLYTRLTLVMGFGSF